MFLQTNVNISKSMTDKLKYSKSLLFDSFNSTRHIWQIYIRRLLSLTVRTDALAGSMRCNSKQVLLVGRVARDWAIRVNRFLIFSLSLNLPDELRCRTWYSSSMNERFSVNHAYGSAREFLNRIPCGRCQVESIPAVDFGRCFSATSEWIIRFTWSSALAYMPYTFARRETNECR